MGWGWLEVPEGFHHGVPPLLGKVWGPAWPQWG